MDYAKAVRDERVTDASLFYFHQQASDIHDLSTREGARAAVIEASGAASIWRDIDAIVDLWNAPTTDRAFWERVWCNRMVQGSSQAFDVQQWTALAQPRGPAKDGRLIVLGFDGSVFNDATGLIATDVEDGYQWAVGIWERPPHAEQWQVPAEEVDALVRECFTRWNVWRMYADPPYWDSWIALWEGLYGKERVIKWFTASRRKMAAALEAFNTVIKTGAIHHSGDAAVLRHIGNARRKDLPGEKDEQGRALWLIQKERSDSPHKMDAAMASVLSWTARTDAIASGALAEGPQFQMMFLGGAGR